MEPQGRPFLHDLYAFQVEQTVLSSDSGVSYDRKSGHKAFWRGLLRLIFLDVARHGQRGAGAGLQSGGAQGLLGRLAWMACVNLTWAPKALKHELRSLERASKEPRKRENTR